MLYVALYFAIGFVLWAFFSNYWKTLAAKMLEEQLAPGGKHDDMSEEDKAFTRKLFVMVMPTIAFINFVGFWPIVFPRMIYLAYKYRAS